VLHSSVKGGGIPRTSRIAMMRDNGTILGDMTCVGSSRELLIVPEASLDTK
jgi:hypothetical protein